LNFVGKSSIKVKVFKLLPASSINMRDVDSPNELGKLATMLMIKK